MGLYKENFFRNSFSTDKMNILWIIISFVVDFFVICSMPEWSIILISVSKRKTMILSNFVIMIKKKIGNNDNNNSGR